MSDTEYDQAVKELAALPERNWVVCRSREQALALLAWMEDEEILDDDE